MIICLCKNVSDQQIKQMREDGKTLQDVVKASEAGTCCGACTLDLKKLFQDEARPQRQTTGSRDS